jgi:hypothetical protein
MLTTEPRASSAVVNFNFVLPREKKKRKRAYPLGQKTPPDKIGHS